MSAVGTADTLPAPSPREVIKTCAACGAFYDRLAWQSRCPILWTFPETGEVLEMVQCHCRSHITIQITPPRDGDDS